MINQFKILFLSTRPKTLLVGVAPVILGLGLSLSNKKELNIYIFLITIACTLLLQVGTNLVNDYYDFIRGVDNNNRLGPERFSSQGSSVQKLIKNSYISCFVISFLLGVILIVEGGLVIAAIGILSIFFAYTYTGGPFPLSHFALGEVLAFLFFGPIAVIGTVFLQLGYIPEGFILQSTAPGFLSAALMSVNNLRDRESDQKCNKITLAVILGKKYAKFLPIILLNAHLVISYVNYYQYNNHWFLIPFLVNLLFSPALILILNKNITSSINRTIGFIGAINFIYCLTTALIFTIQK